VPQEKDGVARGPPDQMGITTKGNGKKDITRTGRQIQKNVWGIATPEEKQKIRQGRGKGEKRKGSGRSEVSQWGEGRGR